jgi:required for meiotic nuclear division protein 1
MDEPGDEETLRVHAVLLGERFGRAAVGADGAVTTAPLSFKVGEAGFVVLFRYGAAVLFGLDEAAERVVLADLAERIAGPVEPQEDESARIVVRPKDEEQITAAGAIQIRTASPEHLLVVADALAKSVALARDERDVAAVFDAIEPFAATLARGGGSPGGRGAILRMIGQALLLQHRVSGRVAVREKPDILWDRRDLERLYGRLEDDYELIERAKTLERKLAFISDATAALIDLKDADRALRLEIIIILLIVAEVALAVVPLLHIWR